MAYVAKKLDRKFRNGFVTRTWDYRGATISAIHHCKAKHLMSWSVAMPDGNGVLLLFNPYIGDCRHG